MRSALELFHPAVQTWFRAAFAETTPAQEFGWPAIEKGNHVLICAPTGSGKTLAAFLSSIHHLTFNPAPEKRKRCRVLYISPLKALAVDVEKNLRAPLQGILNAAEFGEVLCEPTVAIRTGDTPSRERSQFQRSPSDILITTPESLYLLLTSNARENLRSIQWVIVDEIHAMVGTKRGAHLALSLERLASLTSSAFQRIGLSATQRPLEEAARFLGGFESSGDPRPVEIINAGTVKSLDLRVVVPVEDMSRPANSSSAALVSEEAGGGQSIWPAIYPELLDLIRKHRTTLLFVNNRRLAERLAAALNEAAGSDLVRAHHGSVSREQRLQMEDDLKSGRIPAIVATSSLELGIDMGSIDLVIQIESAPSVASALQRVGRAGHQINVASKGILVPKFRGDLVACAALVGEMLKGNVEQIRYLRNPLDVLAQQIVAMVAMENWDIEQLEKVIRGAAPYAELTRPQLHGVLDLLSGRYPSDEFSDLRPRIVWDRISGKLRARAGARLVAIANGGTIPDRGMYHVMLTGAEAGKARVGELDEEMVFETRIGETFLLGTSSWRVDEIRHDRVMVSPAPGQHGKMPFWRGEGMSRPLEFGRAVGKLIATIQSLPASQAEELLKRTYLLDDLATRNILAYIREQQEKSGAVPDDQTIIVEKYVDDLGDWRVCILSTLGGQVHAPWAHAIEGLVRKRLDVAVETLWSDDGIIVRFPETEDPPATELLIPDPEEASQIVIERLGSSPLFASRFREAAARALLLPRRHPAQRTPLWQQRKRAFDLLQVASKYPDFPMVLEAHREILRDVFDMQGFLQILRDISARVIRIVTVNTQSPSPFAASLLIRYVGNFIYEGDAPLAERRAQALLIDQSQLRDLLGESEIRELLEPSVIAATESQLQHLDPMRKARNPDDVHDILLRIGELSRQEIRNRCDAASDTVEAWLQHLLLEKRIVKTTIAGSERWIAAEDAGRYRNALGAELTANLPEVFLQTSGDPLESLVARFAKTHGPFHATQVTGRYGLSTEVAGEVLTRLQQQGRLFAGELTNLFRGQEWCDAAVLKTLRQRSLAHLRREIEPVEQTAYARFLPEWQHVGSGRKGTDALLEVIEQIEGAAIPASVLESQILPARLKTYDPHDLDSLLSSGLIVWCGVERIGQNDGRIALYLTDHVSKLIRPPEKTITTEIHNNIRNFLSTAGASFFLQILNASGAGFKRDVLQALWDLVWSGEVTNDTFLPLRAFLGKKKEKRRKRTSGVATRSGIPAQAAGRWSLVSNLLTEVGHTEHLTALCLQYLNRFGVVTREAISAENLSGGFSSIYPILKAMEEAGKIRRGYFISGRGALQFALPGAVERLRRFRSVAAEPVVQMLASTDPANPYGTVLPWPQREGQPIFGRIAGAQVILVNGELAAYLGKGERTLFTFFDPADPESQITAEKIAAVLAEMVESGKKPATYLTEIDGKSPADSTLAEPLLRHGFVSYRGGWQRKKNRWN